MTIALESANHSVHQPLPPGWDQARLADVCELNPRRPSFTRSADAPTSFIPMPVVAEGGRGIIEAELRPYSAISKGYTFFAEGDVIFAKITPCMQNGKHAIARDLVDGIGFGSTEFHVIRPSSKVAPEWIHFFLIQPWVLQGAAAHFTGAVGQQRVPTAYLANLVIPLPPLREQRRIAALLTEQMEAVEWARAAAMAQLEAARGLIASYLRETFDSDELEQWPAANLGDVLQLRKDIVHPHDRPLGPATFVGLEHIEPQTGVRTGASSVEMSDLTGRKPRFFNGDIVYGYLRPYLNKVWLAEFDGLCSVAQYVYSVVGDKTDADFIAWFMRSPTYLNRAPIGTTPGQLPRIRTDEVAAVPIHLPPIHEQRRIIKRLTMQLDSARSIRGILHEELTAIELMPAALLRKAFTGELTRALIQARPVTLSPDIFFKRGAIASYAIARLHRQSTFGRVQLEKVIYLTETHVGIELSGRYERRAAGPYDSDTLYKLEDLARKEGWFYRRPRGAEGYRYEPGPAIQSRLAAVDSILGNRREVMDHLLGLMARIDTNQAEVITTLFAAWNDFLIDGITPSDEQIIREVRENWHENKQRCASDCLQQALIWMRQHQAVPTGTGPRTRLAPT